MLSRELAVTYKTAWFLLHASEAQCPKGIQYISFSAWLRLTTPISAGLQGAVREGAEPIKQRLLLLYRK
jgi:hypothetical protein